MLGLATTTPGNAPGAFEPFAPMLFSTPCSAAGLSDASHESSEPVACCLACIGEEMTDVNHVERTRIFLKLIMLTKCSV